MHLLLRIAAPFLFVTALPAQATAVPRKPPTCLQTLDSLDSKLRQNYAGFLLEIRGRRHEQYQRMHQTLSHAAAKRELATCHAVLAEYVRWFADPHLFVYQSPTPDSVEFARVRANRRILAIDESALRRRLSARGAAIDPLEGIWFDGSTRYAVIPDPDAKRGVFVAVLLNADTVGWNVGDVRARFVRQTDGSYHTTLVTRAFAEQHVTARIHRRVVLRLSPGMWGKSFPQHASDVGSIDSLDVHRPRITLRARSVVVAVPSHDPRYVRLLDSAVAAADSAIRSRGLLIVDLRGNEGGSSFMTRALQPYIASQDQRPTPFDSGVPVLLSSPAQIAYARRFTGTDTSALIRSLVARMQAAPGTLVPLEETPSAPPTPSVLSGDWRVVVMVDGGTVSASEVLVLHALRSSRATVVGEPTAGALDYQSTQVVSLGTGDRRWALGYPTITAHADLPKRGMRGRGIAPSVRVDWRRFDDPIAEMEKRFGGEPKR